MWLSCKQRMNNGDDDKQQQLLGNTICKPNTDNDSLEIKNENCYVASEIGQDNSPSPSAGHVDKKTRSLPSRVIKKLLKGQHTIFYLMLLMLILVLIALLLWLLNKRFTLPPQLCKRLFLSRKEQSHQYIVEHLERVMEKAKQAETIANKALKRERELAKEVQKLKASLSPNAELAKEPKKTNEDGKLKRLFNNLFEKKVEKELELESDRLCELELIHERIDELEREHNYLRKYATLLERQLQNVDRELEIITDDIQEIDAALTADFASVDSDLQVIDSQLTASLKRHHEERTKINEIVDRLEALSLRTDLNEQNIEKIDELRDQISQVDEAVARNAEAISRQQDVQQEQSQELQDLRSLVDRQANNLVSLNSLLSSRADQLEGLIQTKHQQQKEQIKQVVVSLRHDLNHLHHRLSTDVHALHKICRKLGKKATASNDSLRQYQADLEQLHEELTKVRAKVSSFNPNTVDPKKLALQLRHMEARICHLEEAREQALLHTQQDHQTEQKKRKREQDSASRTSKYNVDEAAKLANTLQSETEAIFKPYQEEAHQRLRDRILGPALKVMDDLEDKYKNAQQVDASFEQS